MPCHGPVGVSPAVHIRGNTSVDACAARRQLSWLGSMRIGGPSRRNGAAAVYTNGHQGELSAQAVVVAVGEQQRLRRRGVERADRHAQRVSVSDDGLEVLDADADVLRGFHVEGLKIYSVDGHGGFQGLLEDFYPGSDMMQPGDQ